MKSFQNYIYETHKTFEFRVKIANVEPKGTVLEAIKNALDAYGLESISKPKRLPIQEHKSFSKLGPCECYIMDVAVRYPTVVEQIRQLIVDRAQVSSDCICVYTKDQAEQEDAVQERIDGQGPVLETPELTADAGGQEAVGEKRVGSLLKELESRKYEIEGTEKADGKTTNELPMGDVSPVGSTKNEIPTPPKGSVR